MSMDRRKAIDLGVHIAGVKVDKEYFQKKIHGRGNAEVSPRLVVVVHTREAISSSSFNFAVVL